MYVSARGLDIIFESFPVDQEIIVETEHDLRFIVNTNDKVIAKSIFITQKPWEIDLLKLVFNILKDRKINFLLDVGANIGTVSIAATKLGYVKNCYAFEPEPLNYKYLKWNIFLNKFQKNILTFNVAVSNSSNDLKYIHLSKNNYGDHQIIYDRKVKSKISVKSSKLDDYFDGLKKAKVLIFIDVQGYETFVIKGAKKFLKIGTPILMEFWPYGIKKHSSEECFIDTLINNGKYQKIIDMKSPKLTLNFSRISLLKLFDKYRLKEDFTDLLVF